MPEPFTREQVARAMNAGAELVARALPLEEREEDLLNLIVNAGMSSLDDPTIGFREMVAQNFDEDPCERWHH